MVRKVGFGRRSDVISESAKQETSTDSQDHELRIKLTKRLVVLGLIEAVGVAILLRGILADDLEGHPGR